MDFVDRLAGLIDNIRQIVYDLLLNVFDGILVFPPLVRKLADFIAKVRITLRTIVVCFLVNVFLHCAVVLDGLIHVVFDRVAVDRRRDDVHRYRLQRVDNTLSRCHGTCQRAKAETKINKRVGRSRRSFLHDGLNTVQLFSVNL